MAVYLNSEKLQGIFKEYAGSEKNTGSTESQIALFTYRIQSLSEHLKDHKKDHSCRRTLLTLVGKRKKMLQYLQGKDLTKYRSLISQLGLRK
ncbi:MAG TPA: 30S ribosomal protein S15 [Saprospiraceae bacterium]|jgi:small subunit ribosomal protein S15|nr:30S ribosomal protein S15 [Saprospiraceae bacterium]MCC6688936.1 30S ribosomal protein S15 [Saprospiraceae bacterium]HMV23200.1 30S ribosomal protein S15 [Saprospiraceae bacterium]HMW74633.1 30S ribosomal protein S15 [Saprospiraceae bacterium]HMX83233.1 30S ribosomal protein S15 [Saprospiraceae bacterium]